VSDQRLYVSTLNRYCPRWRHRLSQRRLQPLGAGRTDLRYEPSDYCDARDAALHYRAAFAFALSALLDSHGAACNHLVLAFTDLRWGMADYCDARDAAHHYKEAFAFAMDPRAARPSDARTLWCLDPPALTTP
jgi:hypothetical protein